MAAVGESEVWPFWGLPVFLASQGLPARGQLSHVGILELTLHAYDLATQAGYSSHVRWFLGRLR